MPFPRRPPPPPPRPPAAVIADAPVNAMMFLRKRSPCQLSWQVLCLSRRLPCLTQRLFAFDNRFSCPLPYRFMVALIRLDGRRRSSSLQLLSLCYNVLIYPLIFIRLLQKYVNPKLNRHTQTETILLVSFSVRVNAPRVEVFL